MIGHHVDLEPTLDQTNVEGNARHNVSSARAHGTLHLLVGLIERAAHVVRHVGFDLGYGFQALDQRGGNLGRTLGLVCVGAVGTLGANLEGEPHGPLLTEANGVGT